MGKVAKKWRIKATAASLVAASSGWVLTPCANASQASAPSAQSVGLGGHRLQHVALTTRDLDRAIVFYRDVLGLPLMFVTNNMAFFDVAGTRLMIALDPERLDARTTSIIYFDAPRFHATVEQLAALGVRLEGGVKVVQHSEAGDLKLQQFRDPDGNALAVMGLVPAQAR